MAVDRPTFSESWYRAAEMRPRLRTTIQTYRQHYRGQMWHVVRDPGNNNFFRLNDAAYFFVGMLDGNRSVQQVWDVCNEQLGDEAPTQGEVIQLLGQLYTSNLLASEVPADAAGMFERHRKRVQREVRSYVQNLLFIRIPLYDPDAFLDRWISLFGYVYTKWTLIPWLALVIVAFQQLSGRFGELFASGSSENILDPANLGWLYVSMAVIKLFHEFGHAFACKKFGRDSQSGGEVHTMGIMFLVLMPVPYVDATSSWALRSRWQRIVIGAGGIFVEIAIASIAAIIWANTQPGVVHSLTFNIMFVASVSTLLFNGNPLLRFDAYYILTDLIEIPNLSNRSKEFIYYLVKRYAYGIQKAREIAHSDGERIWFVIYGIASFIYRIFICVRILLFVADRLFLVGVLLAVGATFTWVFLPLGKWMNYLVTSPELMRTRPRAVTVTTGFILAIFVMIGVVKFEEHDRAEGVIEPYKLAKIYMPEDGFIREVLTSDTEVSAGSEQLVVAKNLDLVRDLKQSRAEKKRAQQFYQTAIARKNASEQETARKFLEAKDKKVDSLEKRVESLTVRAPISGKWVSWDIEDAPGTFMPRGTPIGQVVDQEKHVIRVVASQEMAPRLKKEIGIGAIVDVRAKRRPDVYFTGKVEEFPPSGQVNLPYPSLGYAVQGSIQTSMEDPSGTKTTEPFFELRINKLQMKEAGHAPPVFSGQRVMVRFNLGKTAMAVQWWRKIRQLVQRRFHTL